MGDRRNFQFKISETLFSSEEAYAQQDKDSYLSLFNFLEGKTYVSENFEEFITDLKKCAGLVIIFPRHKVSEVRNNMIRAFNNLVCIDILKQARIFPVMTESVAANEFIKELSPKEYPVYLFCKYKNSQVMTISAMVEKKFRMDNVINNLLDSFPENDVKQSIYKSINTSIINFKKVKPNTEDDDFSGDENEVNNLLQKLKKDVNSMDTLFQNKTNNKNNNLITTLNNNMNNNNNLITTLNNNINNRNNLNNNLITTLNNNININNNLNNNINNEDENPFSKPLVFEKKEENPSNNKKGVNRFQDMFDNNETSILIGKNMKGINPIYSESVIGPNIMQKKNIKPENVLPKEPDENDPDACTVIFRYPYDEKTIKRRFNKNDKIEVLFNYVQSLGREIYSKPDFNSFELIYGYPPISFESKKDQTLNDEGLFPSSTINIVEK